MVTFPLSPLMHGGAQAGLLMHLFAGHLTILEPKFDAQRTWEIIEREGVQLIFMTGDAMARPLIEEFERKAATGTPYDASSLFAVSSSAAIFSASVKERWMAAFPNTVFTDSVGASETGFQGMGLQDKDHISTDGPVVGLGPSSVVIDDDNHVLDLATNVGAVGRLGRGGSVPLGYYKDPEKSARTFLEIDGERYSVPGDFARIEADDKVTLLGRGLELHQHRRGEGLPRGGGDGDQGPPGRVRRARGRRARREVRPVRHRGDPAARGGPGRARGPAQLPAQPRSPATSCRAR